MSQEKTSKRRKGQEEKYVPKGDDIKKRDDDKEENDVWDGDIMNKNEINKRNATRKATTLQEKDRIKEKEVNKGKVQNLYIVLHLVVTTANVNICRWRVVFVHVGWAQYLQYQGNVVRHFLLQHRNVAAHNKIM